MRASRIYLSLIAVLMAACADQEPIGTTEWTVSSYPGSVDVSSGGRIIESGQDFVAALGSDGTQLWRQDGSYNSDVDVDSGGNVYVVRADAPGQWRLARLSAVDGATERSIDLGMAGGNIVVGSDDVVWQFNEEPDGLQTRWTQYGTSGDVIATGRLGFPIGPGGIIALPEGGLLMTARSHLSIVDKAGSVTWRGDDVVDTFASHDDGEISAFTSNELVRYAPDHQVRWRHRIDRPSVMRSAGDRLLVGSYNDVGSELELFDRDGESIASEWFGAQVSLVATGRGDGYLLTYFGSESVDLHDRVVPFEGDLTSGELLSGLAARRLP